MVSAGLADEVLTHLGDFLDDHALCALACSERLRWDRSAPQRQTRKDEQEQILQLLGRAECCHDCERATRLLCFASVAPFVGECFWGTNDDRYPDVWFHLEFRSSRRNLPLLRRAVKTFLRGLRALSDLHVLRETLTFRDEFTGDRLRDDGAQHQGDILRQVFDKVTWCAKDVEPYPHNFDIWEPLDQP